LFYEVITKNASFNLKGFTPDYYYKCKSFQETTGKLPELLTN